MIEAVFIERKNRFTALVNLRGEPVRAHVANSGRLKELFVPGARVYLEEQKAPHRATGYDLALVEYQGRLVSVDARVPNRVVSEAIDRGELAEFAGCRVVKKEVKFGGSRLDILLEDNSHNRCYVEVKSVTLVTAGTARFPDAPTERGARHLGELTAAVREGHRAAVVFLIQREDASAFSPNDVTDPGFGAALRVAVAAGVEAHAYTCRISVAGISVIGPVPVAL